ncbi:MAG: oligosaccharide flippase family protein [Blastocatellia bacterium]|nr:oligosaccharide flippase family protein [Blastocatellia bacterium]
MSKDSLGNTLSGTVKVFISEAIILPTAIVAAAFLTRKLTTSEYGQLALAATIVAWVEWTISSFFSRSALKLVSEAEDWRPISSLIIKLHFLMGVCGMFLVGLFAKPTAIVLNEPTLARYLLYFSLDIPFWCIGFGYKNILISIGKYNARAIVSMTRWMLRLLLIILFVECGFGVDGVIAANILASLVEVLVCRLYANLPLWQTANYPARRLLAYSLPLFLFSLFMRLYDKIDLMALKALGGSAEQAGVYAAAQNLTVVPGLFSFAFTSLLLSTLTRLFKTNNRDEVVKMSTQSMRLILFMLPFASLSASVSDEIALLLFGKQFEMAGSVLAILIFGSVAISMLSVTTAILTAADRQNLTVFLVVPLLPITLFGHYLAIPKYGLLGAASVSAATSLLSALASLLIIYRLFKLSVSSATFLRSSLVSLFVYRFAVYLPMPGLLLIAKIALISLSIPLLLLLLGEFSSNELRQIKEAVVARLATISRESF